MHQRFMGNIEELGEREVGIICATDQLARDGHVLEPAGIDVTNYRSNPIVLFAHDPECPVGCCTAIGIENGALAAKVEFAPAGVSVMADEICGLVKAGIVCGVNVGFDPVETVPLDPSRGARGGPHITASELLEISFCSVPVDTGPVLWRVPSRRAPVRWQCCDPCAPLARELRSACYQTLAGRLSDRFTSCALTSRRRLLLSIRERLGRLDKRELSSAPRRH